MILSSIMDKFVTRKRRSESPGENTTASSSCAPEDVQKTVQEDDTPQIYKPEPCEYVRTEKNETVTSTGHDNDKPYQPTVELSNLPVQSVKRGCLKFQSSWYSDFILFLVGVVMVFFAFTVIVISDLTPKKN